MPPAPDAAHRGPPPDQAPHAARPLAAGVTGERPAPDHAAQSPVPGRAPGRTEERDEERDEERRRVEERDERLDAPGREGAGCCVEVRGLTKSYGSVTAVDDLTWSARTGAITTVLGPNGAGKTTTISCLLGLLHPDAGQVCVLGVDPWSADADHRARVGIMLQDGGLPNTVGAHRLLPHLARLYAHPRDPDELIARLGIAGFARTPVRRLSGGQRQRVALAAALVGRPELAFLDEPTAGLDPHARRQTWDLLRELRDEGVSLVVTTHSFEEAQRLADDVVIVSAGRVVAAGPLAQVAGERGLEETYFALTAAPETS